MTRLLLLLLALACPAAAESDLTPLPPLPEAEAREWPAIGRIWHPQNPARGFCSGALVAPDVVLTAGHCAPNGGPTDPEKQSLFLAGAFNSDTAATRRVTGRLRHPIYRSEGHHTPDYDIGLWLLDSPIDDIAPLPLGTAQDMAVAILGYHHAIPFRLSGRTDCPLKDDSNGLMTIGCRVISGNSGSPVLQARPDGSHEIVAVASSQSGPDAIAVRIGTWVREAIAQHLSR